MRKMVYLKNLKQAQSVCYAQDHRWDLKFQNYDEQTKTWKDLKGPFQDWFPASGAALDLFNITSHSVQTTIGSASVPSKLATDLNFQVTFYDDQNASLETWLRDWYEEIFPKDERGAYSHVTRLEGSVKKATLIRVDNKRKILKLLNGKIWALTLYVYPEGLLPFAGSSEGGMLVYNQTFKVAGIQQL